MAVNKFFHDSNKTSIAAERNLYKDLVKEAIQIHGHDVYYVNRTFVNEDTLFGEDNSSTFSESQLIEMYVENAEGGLEGDKELVSKFGLEIRDDTTFVIAKRRWQNQVDNQAVQIVDGRPNEGDLIYVPLMNSFFEIQFVEDQEPFFQLGNLPVFKLKTTKFEYSSEKIDTGRSEIDVAEDRLSIDQLQHQYIQN